MSKMKPRKGENLTENQKRSHRFVETDEGWFFRTREGIDVGPYPTEFDAEVCASLLTARLKQLDPSADVRGVIQSFLSDPTSGPRSAQFRPAKVTDAREPATKTSSSLAVVARMKALLERAKNTRAAP